MLQGTKVLDDQWSMFWMMVENVPNSTTSCIFIHRDVNTYFYQVLWEIVQTVMFWPALACTNSMTSAAQSDQWQVEGETCEEFICQRPTDRSSSSSLCTCRASWLHLNATVCHSQQTHTRSHKPKSLSLNLHIFHKRIQLSHTGAGMLGDKTGKEDKWLVIYHPLSFSAPLLFKQATASRENRIITNHSTFSFCPHWDTFVTTVTLISPPVHHRSPTKLNLRGRAAFWGSFNPFLYLWVKTVLHHFANTLPLKVL